VIVVEGIGTDESRACYRFALERRHPSIVAGGQSMRRACDRRGALTETKCAGLRPSSRLALVATRPSFVMHRGKGARASRACSGRATMRASGRGGRRTCERRCVERSSASCNRITFPRGFHREHTRAVPSPLDPCSRAPYLTSAMRLGRCERVRRRERGSERRE